MTWTRKTTNWNCFEGLKEDLGGLSNVEMAAMKALCQFLRLLIVIGPSVFCLFSSCESSSTVRVSTDKMDLRDSMIIKYDSRANPCEVDQMIQDFERSNSDCHIEDVLISNMRMSGDLFSCEVEAIVKNMPEAEFHTLDRNDLRFRSTGLRDRSTVIYQIKDKSGFVLGSGSKDGRNTKKEITFPYKNIPVEENGMMVFATLKVNGKTIDKVSRSVVLSQEALSSPELATEGQKTD